MMTLFIFFSSSSVHQFTSASYDIHTCTLTFLLFNKYQQIKFNCYFLFLSFGCLLLLLCETITKNFISISKWWWWHHWICNAVPETHLVCFHFYENYSMNLNAMHGQNNARIVFGKSIEHRTTKRISAKLKL